MDGDTTKTKNSYEEILSAFAAAKADILIGTQMTVSYTHLNYIEFVENEIGFPITMISNGPGRDDIIYRNK